jgi:hypothetical protein
MAGYTANLPFDYATDVQLQSLNTDTKIVKNS